jgi:hypothetical protein
MPASQPRPIDPVVASMRLFIGIALPKTSAPAEPAARPPKVRWVPVELPHHARFVGQVDGAFQDTPARAAAPRFS